MKKLLKSLFGYALALIGLGQLDDELGISDEPSRGRTPSKPQSRSSNTIQQKAKAGSRDQGTTVTLRDRDNHVIGYIRNFQNGDKIILDTRRIKIGHYTASQDVSYDKNNHKIGRGDLLATLLGQA